MALRVILRFAGFILQNVRLLEVMKISITAHVHLLVFDGSENHYKKKRVLRPLKLTITTVRRVANVHLRLFPNRR
jgi:hypothetical protein